MTLLAAFGLGSYEIPGRDFMAEAGWPQPIGWIIQAFVVEAWPTYSGTEIRWAVWAAGNALLVLLAVVSARAWPDHSRRGHLAVMLAGLCAALVLAVAVRAAWSRVPVVGLAWTWQLGIGLSWMCVICWWSLRLPAEVWLKAVAVGLVGLAVASLAYSVQGGGQFPAWPAGNVLLLSTACVAGIFLTGTWAYSFLATRWEPDQRARLAGGVAACAALLVMAVAAAMAARRSAIVGLAGGAALLLFLTLRGSRGGKAVLAGVVLLAALVGGTALPRLLRTGRWESVILRRELYRSTAAAILEQRCGALIGLGPGHIAFDLTFRMRPLRAESPRLFHGQISEHAHSEPLEILAELGFGLGLLILALPVAGLLGYVRGYGRAESEPARLAILGMGSALAGVLAAESTSIGMRHPGVAALTWALVGVGLGCALGRAEGDPDPSWPGRLRPLADKARKFDRLGRPAALCIAIGLMFLAGWSVLSSGYLRQGLDAWAAGRLEASHARLRTAWFVPTAGQWLRRQYALGRVALDLADRNADAEQALGLQREAVDSLGAVVRVCPGYLDAGIWLGRAKGDPDQLAGLAGYTLRIDPYEPQARLVMAGRAEDAWQRLQQLRLAIRNAPIDADLAGQIVEALSDAAVQDLWQKWLAAAQEALTQVDPAEWSDPLALETLRMAVLAHAESGRIANAAEAAEQAAVLCRRLERDSWRRRPEMVELETYMHEAWFGWLNRPSSWRRYLALLAARIDALVRERVRHPTARASLQFLAILQLAAGRQRQAEGSLLLAEGLPAPVLLPRRLVGLCYARLIQVMNPVASAGQLEIWSKRSRKLLGEETWEQIRTALAGAAPRGWWQGVLPKP